MAIISSPANERIRQIRGLAQRKERERTGLFFVEGTRSVREALELRAPLEYLVVAPELLDQAAADVLAAVPRQIPQLEVSGQVFRGIAASFSLKYGPRGIGAVVQQRWKPLAPILPTGHGCWLALHGLEDPGNLGTIMRTCDAVGMAGIILIDHGTDPYDPAAVRASLGAIFAQRLSRATFGEFAAWIDRTGLPLVGTSGAAEHDFRCVRYPPSLVVLMGSERRGLSSEQQQLCDAVVRIPMVGRRDSLNVAVATGVMLYEVERQRQLLNGPLELLPAF